jgi:hypothetical protein
VFLLNSHLGPFSVTPTEPGYPLFQSYGARLPSSLTRVISIALGLLSLPTRVGLRYGRYGFKGNEAFLDGVASVESPWVSPQLPLIFNYIRGGFACPGIISDERHTMSNGYARLNLPCPPFASTTAVQE